MSRRSTVALAFAAGLLAAGCGAPRPATCEAVVDIETEWPFTRITLVSEELVGADAIAAVWRFDPQSVGESRITVGPTVDVPQVPHPDGLGRMVPPTGARHLELVFEGADIAAVDDLYSPEQLIQSLHLDPIADPGPRWVVGVAADACVELALDRTVPALLLRAYPHPRE